MELGDNRSLQTAKFLIYADSIIFVPIKVFEIVRRTNKLYSID